MIGDHHPGAWRETWVRYSSRIRQNDAFDPRAGENPNARRDLARTMPFIKMNAALGKDDSRFADFSQNETARVSRHRRLRQFGELGIRENVLRFGLRHHYVETGTENDRGLGVPRLEAFEGHVGHNQAAEMGGADSGLRVPAITSGCNLSSRIGVILESCFG
jgi:hypothetical protein